MASCSGPSGIEGEGTPRDALLDAAADASSGTGACIVDGTTRDDLLDTDVDALLDALPRRQDRGHGQLLRTERDRR